MNGAKFLTRPLERFNKIYAISLKPEIIELSIIALLSLTPLLWFKNGMIINGGDFDFPLTPINNLYRHLFTWDDRLFMGFDGSAWIPSIFPYFTLLALLELIGFSIIAIQKLFFIYVFLIPGLSMYFLAKTLEKQGLDLIPIIASLYYMFNFYVMSRWHDGHPTLLMTYGVIPLIIAFLLKGMVENKARHYIYIGFFTLFLDLSNPPMVAAFGILILVILVSKILIGEFKISMKSVKFITLALSLSILLNLWRILPLANMVRQFHLQIPYNSLEVELYSSSKFSSILELLRNLGYWGFYTYFKDVPYFSFSNSYKNTSLIILSIFFIGLIVLPVLIYKKSKRLMPLYIILLMGVFFSKGVHPPLGNIFKWLFENVPFFWLFRYPWNKFFPYIIFSYSILVAVTCKLIYDLLRAKYKNSDRLIKNMITLVSASFIFFYSYPLLTGEVIEGERKILPNFHVKIPPYFNELKDFINNDVGDYKILLLPPQAFGYEAYSWGYGGADIMPHILQKPLVSGMAGSSGIIYSSQLRDLIRNIFSKSINVDLSKILGLINVKYIIQRNDINASFYDGTLSSEEISSFLLTQKNIKFYKRIGEFDIYKISDSDYLPHIYVTSHGTLINGNINSLIPLSNSNLVNNGEPFLMTEQLNSKQKADIIRKVNSLAFQNSNPADMALDIINPPYIFKVKTKQSKALFESKIKDIYYILAKKYEELPYLIYSNVRLFVDNLPILPLSKQDERIINSFYWEFLGSVALNPGKHLLSGKIPNNIDELLFVSKNKFYEYLNMIILKMKNSNSKVTYIFSPENYSSNQFAGGSIYIPSSANYTVSTKIKPDYVYKKELGLKLSMDSHNEINKWSLLSKNTMFNYTQKINQGLIMEVFFDGDEREDEYIEMKRGSILIDLKKFPFIDLFYRVENPAIQTIEVVLGIDYTGDGFTDGYIKGLTTRSNSNNLETYQIRAYDQANRKFPGMLHYNLVEIELYPHKIWGVDCSWKPMAKNYLFQIKLLEVYNLRITDNLLKRDYAIRKIFNEKYLLNLKINDGAKDNIAFKIINDVLGIKTKNINILNKYVEIELPIEKIDIKKYPIMELEYKVNDSSRQAIEILLDLDINGDNKIDSTYSLGYPNIMSTMFNKYKKNIIETLSYAIPPEAKISSKLMKIKIRLHEIGKSKFIEEQDSNREHLWYLRDLRIYSEKDSRNIQWLIEDTFLAEGQHDYDFFLARHDDFNLDYLIIGNNKKIINDKNIKIDFLKINPVKYLAKVEAQSPFWLIFSESYHPGWKAYIKKGNFTGLLKEHFVANGYANGWYIDHSVASDKLSDKDFSQFEILIQYAPQRLFELGVFISIITFAMVAVCMIVQKYQKRRKDK